MRRAIPLLVTMVVLLTGCDSRPTASKPTITGTATVISSPALSVSPTPGAASPTAERVATGTAVGTHGPSDTGDPVRAWDVPPKTGVPHVDAIVAAMVAGRPADIVPFLEVGVRPRKCAIALNAGDLICAPGVPDGTLV